MTEYVCEQCGAANAQNSQFCRSYDAYLGWDAGATTIGGQPVTGTVPEAVTALPIEDPTPAAAPHLAPAEAKVATAPARARRVTSRSSSRCGRSARGACDVGDQSRELPRA